MVALTRAAASLFLLVRCSQSMAQFCSGAEARAEKADELSLMQLRQSITHGRAPLQKDPCAEFKDDKAIYTECQKVQEQEKEKEEVRELKVKIEKEREVHEMKEEIAEEPVTEKDEEMGKASEKKEEFDKEVNEVAEVVEKKKENAEIAEVVEKKKEKAEIAEEPEKEKDEVRELKQTNERFPVTEKEKEEVHELKVKIEEETATEKMKEEVRESKGRIKEKPASDVSCKSPCGNGVLDRTARYYDTRAFKEASCATLFDRCQTNTDPLLCAGGDCTKLEKWLRENTECCEAKAFCDTYDASSCANGLVDNAASTPCTDGACSKDSNANICCKLPPYFSTDAYNVYLGSGWCDGGNTPAFKNDECASGCPDPQPQKLEEKSCNPGLACNPETPDECWARCSKLHTNLVAVDFWPHLIGFDEQRNCWCQEACPRVKTDWITQSHPNVLLIRSNVPVGSLNLPAPQPPDCQDEAECDALAERGDCLWLERELPNIDDIRKRCPIACHACTAAEIAIEKKADQIFNSNLKSCAEFEADKAIYKECVQLQLDEEKKTRPEFRKGELDKLKKAEEKRKAEMKNMLMKLEEEEKRKEDMKKETIEENKEALEGLKTFVADSEKKKEAEATKVEEKELKAALKEEEEEDVTEVEPDWQQAGQFSGEVGCEGLQYERNSLTGVLSSGTSTILWIDGPQEITVWKHQGSEETRLTGKRIISRIMPDERVGQKLVEHEDPRPKAWQEKKDAKAKFHVTLGKDELDRVLEVLQESHGKFSFKASNCHFMVGAGMEKFKTLMQRDKTLMQGGIASLKHHNCDDWLEVKGSTKKMPARGFITCCDSFGERDSFPGDDGGLDYVKMAEAIKGYLREGGRLIDTAPGYGYEKTVGNVVKDSGIERDDLWLSSKIETTGWRPTTGTPADWVLAQVDQSLSNMGADYLDSMVLHYGPKQARLEKKFAPAETAFLLADFVEMWKGLIEAKQAGKVRNIGVCLSTRKEIENLIEKTGVTPSIALVWDHPWVPTQQKEYVSWLKSKDIAVQAYGLFEPFKNVLYLDVANEIAKSHDITPRQVAIQWVRTKGVGFLTRSKSKFVDDDMKCLDSDSTLDFNVFTKEPDWTCDFTYKFEGQYMPGCEA